MRRIAAVLLILCAGCASPGGETLLDDSLFGDVRALFGASPNSHSAPAASISSPTTSSSVAPAAKPNE